MNLNKPEGCFKPYISSDSPLIRQRIVLIRQRILLRSLQKRQNVYEAYEGEKVTLPCLWPMSWLTWSCVWICPPLVMVLANLLNLGTVRMTFLIHPRTNCAQVRPVKDTAFLPATQYSRLHRERTDFWTLFFYLFAYLCSSSSCSHPPGVHTFTAEGYLNCFQDFGLREFFRLTNSCCFDIF